MNRIWQLVAVLILAGAWGFTAPAPASAQDAPAEGKEAYDFYLPLSRGLADGSFNKLMRDISDTLASVTGLEIEFTADSYDVGAEVNDMVYEKMTAGEADVSYVNSIEYLEEREKWDEIFRPAFYILFNNKYYNEYCLYVSRDSDAETVENTRGMVWGGMDTVQTRQIMHEAGINETIDEFFSDQKFLFESPVTNYLGALAKGEIDVFVANKGHMIMSGGVPGSIDKEKIKSIAFKEITCLEGEHSWIFGFHKDVPREDVTAVMKNLLRAHKSAEFRQFGFLFAAIKGHFAPFKEENLERTKEIVELKKEYGWEEEQEKYFKMAPEREEE